DGRWWERLQDFSLSRASSWEEPTPESANNLLRALQGIRKQLVRLELIHMPFPTEMPLQFPRLRELHIRDVPGWELIECDGLERLKFRGPPIIDGLQITYPHVRELDISDLYEDYGLAYLDLPELNTLTFEHKQRESILRCPKDICDRVKTVRLCLKSLNSSHLHLVLPDFTSLETLEIYDTPPFVPFFQRFEARHGQPPLCPTLRRLSIDFSELSHMITKDFLAAIFQKVVDSRISSYPLQSLRVEWPVKQVCRFTEPQDHLNTQMEFMDEIKDSGITKEPESDMKEVQQNRVDLVLSKAAVQSPQDIKNSPNYALSTTQSLPNELIREVFLRCVNDGEELHLIPEGFGQQSQYPPQRSTDVPIPIRNLVITAQTSKVFISFEVASALIQERERWDTVEFLTPYTVEQASILFDSTIPHTVQKVVFGWEVPVAFHWLETANPVSLSIQDDVLLGGRWWTRLQEFSFLHTSPWTTPTLTTRNSLLRVLQGVCTQLTHLELAMIPFPSQTSLQFPRLRELSVQDVEGWQLIECSNLTTLKLGNVYSIDGLETIYPNVRELDLSMWYRDGALIQLGLPGLDTLIVNDKFRDNIPRCPKEICNNIKRLQLCLQTLGSSLLYDMIGEFSNLESLKIYDTPPSISFYQRFETGHQQPPLCLSLKRISIDCSQLGHMIDKDILGKTFHGIVESRRHSHPLKSLRVEWPLKQGGGSTEFA
ncbi:hypothetical protein FRC17_005389, partial [Serendipita sp. 399]